MLLSIQARHLLFKGTCFFLHFTLVSNLFVGLTSIPKLGLACVSFGFKIAKSYIAMIGCDSLLRNVVVVF